MLFSLIIPVYKVEHYIKDCLESVLQQLTSDIEVIIVNDGTPDNSMQIIDKLIFNYSKVELKNNLKIINQENQGQSAARNSAINAASGEYICFLDSDDILEESYFEKLKKIIVDNSPDIIQFKSERFNINLKSRQDFNVGVCKEGLYFNDKEILLEVFNQSAWFPWLNIYKRILFNGKSFPLGVYYEDAALIPDIFVSAKKVYFYPETLYFYRFNNYGSLLNSSKENLAKHLKSYDCVLKIYENRLQFNDLYSPSFVSLSQGYVSFLMKNYGFSKAFKAHKFFIKNKRNVNYSKVLKRGNKLYYKFGIFFIAFLLLVGRI